MLLLAIAALAAACGPIVARAPFSSRPESLEPGDLLGPFDGVVLDAETERPLAEAVVSASWAFERGIGVVGPAGHRTVILSTTPDGRYEVPRLEALPGGASARVARFTLVIYRRGYVGWRSDQIYPAGEPRRDFSQRRNVVRLARWREGLSHANHLAFLGGSPAIQQAAAWERQPAALELRGPAPEAEPTPAAGLLDASPLLSEADVRALSGYAQPLQVGRLADLPRSEFYDSLHFQAEAAPTERDDVALRLWRLGPVAAEAQYRSLLQELPEPEARGEVGDASARVAAGEVRGMVFLVREPGFVVSVTCGVGQCPQPETLVNLSLLVRERLSRIPAPPNAEAEGEAPEPAPGDVLDPFGGADGAEDTPSGGEEAPGQPPEGSTP